MISLYSFVLFCFVLFCFVFQDRVSLCSLDYPRTHSEHQAGFELIDRLPLLGLKACATITQIFKNLILKVCLVLLVGE